MNVEKKIKNILQKKKRTYSVFKEATFKPFEQTMTFFSANSFFIILFNIYKKNAFDTDSRFFHKNMHVIKKNNIFDRNVFKLQCFSKVFLNVGENALF